MKKARVINAIVHSCVGIALASAVSVAWWQQGCGFAGVIAAIVFYGSITAVTWCLIDDILKK